MTDNPPISFGSTSTGTTPGIAPAHAGFRAANPAGVGSSPSGPTLSGWPRQITWAEFRVITERPSGENEAAQISIEIPPLSAVKVAREDGQFRLGRVVFRMKVVRRGSWVVSSQKGAELLRHEQGHFDLTGLTYRDMVAVLAALRASSTDELQQEVERVMREYDRISDELSVAYDGSTDHGLDRDRQEAWNSRIQESIQRKTHFKPPE